MVSDSNINTAGFRRYFANTSWLMGHRVLSMMVALFVGVYVARYLGPEQFGLLSYAGSFVALFTALASLGLDSIVIRELIKEPGRRDALLGTAFWLKAGGAVLMWGCIITAVPFTSNDAQTNILIAIIAFAVIFQAFNVIDYNYQAQVKSKYVVFVQIIQLVVSSATKIILVCISAPLVWFACVFLLDSVLIAGGLAIAYTSNRGKLWFWDWHCQTAKQLLRDSWPLILSGIAISVYLRIGQVMIKEMLDAEQVGLYAAAARLSEAWYFIPVAISSSVFPAIINSKKMNEALYYQRLQKLYYLMVLIALTIALPTTFLAPWVIGLLYGSAYLPAAGVLSIHIWTGVFVFLGVASGKWFLAENYINKNLYRTLLGMVINIAANLILIPVYGILGAAIAALLGQLAADLLYDVFDKQTYPSLKMKINALNPFNLLHYAYQSIISFKKI